MDNELKAICRRGVAAHLHEVNGLCQNLRILRVSLRLYVKTCIIGSPPDRPFCTCVLFGEDHYFLDSNRGTGGPPGGYRLIALDDSKDEEEKAEGAGDWSSAT